MKTVYVNLLNASGTEDGLTHATGFTSIVDWLAAETKALTDDITVLCSGGADVLTAAPAGIDLLGFTNLGTFSITITGDPSGPGAATGAYYGTQPFSAAHYHMSGTQRYLVQVSQGDPAGNGFKLDQLQLQNNSGFIGGDESCIRCNSGAIGLSVTRCRLIVLNNKYGISEVNAATAQPTTVIGNVLWCANNFNARTLFLTGGNVSTNQTLTIAGNTVITGGGAANDGVRISRNSQNSTIVCKNTWVADQTDPNAAFLIDGAGAGTLDMTNDSCPSATPPAQMGANWFESAVNQNLEIEAATSNSDPEVGDLTPLATGVLAGNGVTGYELDVDIAGNPYNSPPELGAFNLPGGAPPAGNPYQMLI